jgi:DNA-binding Xre family transcriptional regulator
MKWNLRMGAAHRDICKPSEPQRLLATEGLTISAAKAYHLGSGKVQKIDLSDPDTICAALRCGVDEILIPSTAHRIDDQRDQTPPASPAETPLSPRRCVTDQDTPVRVRLLGDLQAVFEGVNALHTVTAPERLHQLHGRPWMHEHGELTTRSLASHLRPYGVVPTQVYLGGVNRSRYRRQHLQRAWGRHLPRPPDADATSPVGSAFRRAATPA